MLQLKVNKLNELSYFLESKTHNLNEKQQEFELQLQHFSSDISELVITAVCQRINEKSKMYIPNIVEQLTELKEVSKDHTHSMVDLKRSSNEVKRI